MLITSALLTDTNTGSMQIYQPDWVHTQHTSRKSPMASASRPRCRLAVGGAASSSSSSSSRSGRTTGDFRVQQTYQLAKHGS